MDVLHEDLEREYRLRFEKTADYRNRVWRLLTKDFFQTYVPIDGVVLDLGCGWGEFVTNIRARVKYGMDLNPESGRKLSPGVTFLKQDCSERWPLPDASLDTVFSSNFLEHLPTKTSVHDALAEAWRCLKPGGRLVCVGPNVRYLPGEYWDFWDHQVALSERSLGELLELIGFRIEVSTARFLPYSMSQGFTPPTVFLSIYLRLKSVWPVFGKQFLVVAKKSDR